MPKKSHLTLPVLDLGEETLGQRIARLRKEQGKTQVTLARQIGIVQNLISDYEHDKIRPYPEMLVRFALALGVTTDDLLGCRNLTDFQRKKQSMQPEIASLVSKFERLSGAQCEALIKVADLFLENRH